MKLFEQRLELFRREASRLAYTLRCIQQKMMRHADIRTTFNIYGDVITDEMTTAGAKVAQLAFMGTERNQSAA